MDEITIKSPAKINLTLDIIRKLDSGYHEIESIMQQIGLYDTVKLVNSDEIKIDCNDAIPLKENLVLKAIKLIKDKYNITNNVEVSIEKKIPIAAGLSGGSTNAAATLTGLNQLWDINMDKQQLMDLAKEIGMDVSFHILGGTCLATGRGEIIKKLDSFPGMHILLINPDFEISTTWAYKNLDRTKIGKEKRMKKILDIKNPTIKDVAGNLHNDFEESIAYNYPLIKKIKQQMIEQGALNAVLSGSGPTVFGIFEDEDKLDKAYENLKSEYNLIFKTTSIR